MAEVNLILECVFEKEPTDLSICSGCNDIIFSDMYRPVYLLCGRVIAPLEMVFCASCFNALKKEE